MKRRLFVALGIFALLSAALAPQSFAQSAVSASQDSFKIGIAPHTSARVIIEQYQPVRAALQSALGMPVEILTAPDFTEFARRALNQEYDLAVTTGHQARLFETDAAYIPLLTYQADFKSVVVVPNEGAKAPKDLNGATVIGLSPSSLVTIWGEHWLKQNSITSTVRYVSAADSVAQLMLAGEAQAGLMSLANFQSLSAETRSKLRFLVESDALAGRVYMLNGRRAAVQDKLRQALFAFSQTPEGRQYFDSTKLMGYRLLKPNELQIMDPYADVVRQVLKAK